MAGVAVHVTPVDLMRERRFGQLERRQRFIRLVPQAPAAQISRPAHSESWPHVVIPSGFFTGGVTTPSGPMCGALQGGRCLGQEA